jgi:hypothetical protein
MIVLALKPTSMLLSLVSAGTAGEFLPSRPRRAASIARILAVTKAADYALAVRRRTRAWICTAALAALSAACGGPDPIAFKNRVFYEYGGEGADDLAKAFETPYPPLDLDQAPNGLSYMGVAVLAVYERIESPREPWRIVMERYEDELQKSGGVLLSKAVPAATWNAQARAYDVQRPVAAPKEPYLNYSREYLARSEKRIVLIQMVRPTDSLRPVSSELMRVVQTLQVL